VRACVQLIAAGSELAESATLAILATLVAGLAVSETVTGEAIRYETRQHESG